ncbi:hypothetical protein ES708_18172 [subsurface metagenome]
MPPPLGAIALWSGVLGAIPANWSLCDGTGGTPNLVAKFLRGAPAATEPGTTGGADSHTHASMTADGGHAHTLNQQSHSHTVNSAGTHNHKVGEFDGNAGPSESMIYNAGSHTHTTPSSAHTHTATATGDHTHVRSTDDGRPPYYEIAYIQAGAGALVAANLIVVWTGLLANIPTGWSLCDGGDGRPDLRSRFLRGVNTAVTEPGTVGGTATHGHTETAQAAHSHGTDVQGTHSHDIAYYTWAHDHNSDFGTGTGGDTPRQSDDGAGNHNHAASDYIGGHDHDPLGNDGGHAHVVNTASSLPTYYDVAYIINDGGAVTIPQNGVLIWAGLLANIPIGYNLCDGGGGRPELRAKFLRGSNAGVNPGGLGGADTHTHTDQNAGAHSAHSQASAGVHQHAATDTLGSHTHSLYALVHPGTTGPSSRNYGNAVGGAHAHTYDNENDHTHPSLTDPGNHTHNPWSTDDGRPAYYEVAFIQKL